MAKKPQINPLDHTTSPPPAKRFLHNHRFFFFFLLFSIATLILLTLTTLTLIFTAFKLTDPKLTMNSLHIDRLHIPSLIPSLSSPFSLNATLTADISIQNPNAVSFRFRNSTTDFFYAGDLVGVAYAPAGTVAARRTVRMNLTVDVMADRVVMDTDVAGAVLGAGWVNITSFTGVNGRVCFLGFYKRDLEILMNCSFTLGVWRTGFADRVCEANVL